MNVSGRNKEKNKMSHSMRYLLFLFVCFGLMAPRLAVSQVANEATEPAIMGPGVIDLLAGGTLDAWDIPSKRWKLEGGSIVAETGTEKLKTPEWLYTKQRFSDFEFTCELKLTGDNHRNTGIYYRANTINYKDRFDAASGYEFDAAPSNNFWGSLGDWYERPSLRVYADPEVISKVVNPDDWNRMTIRARGNRLEYWINGIKTMDYVDHDPKGSREGVIGFQIHDGSVMKIEFRNIRVLSLEP